MCVNNLITAVTWKWALAHESNALTITPHLNHLLRAVVQVPVSLGAQLFLIHVQTNIVIKDLWFEDKNKDLQSTDKDKDL